MRFINLGFILRCDLFCLVSMQVFVESLVGLTFGGWALAFLASPFVLC